MGRGFAPGYHGELVSGVFATPGGTPRIGVLRLPWPEQGAAAEFAPHPGAQLYVRAASAAAAPARQAAETALGGIRAPWSGGRLTVHTEAEAPVWPVAPAVVRAVADAWGLCPGAAELATAVSEVDAPPGAARGGTGLVDAVDGSLIEAFEADLPPLLVLGFDPGDVPSGPGLDPDDASLADLAAGRRLRGLLRRAAVGRDAALFAAAATESTLLLGTHRPRPLAGHLAAALASCGALGLQSDRGTSLLGLLFPPDAPGLADRLARARTLLAGLGIHQVWQFTTTARRAG
ncbi:hypothetical protein [Saccharothrix sp. ST-888]|uniref:hypothetical protein n=1 Tax=Saccharothrix sp. ST-888 TaxID=1427391 RepID=UPI0005EBFE99|nr:hypothetical protein [Saccharothrix sp. ST-888]KJK55406.1 hypothetical protein UK12_28855 [Saccharothrix sp. ST-888]